MAKRKARPSDPLNRVIESALQPGRFIPYRGEGDFVSDLNLVRGRIESLVRARPARALALYETFLAGCYEKAEEVDGSSGSFNQFVQDLLCGWIGARQASNADRDETARLLLARMDRDPYCFCLHLERSAVKVFDSEGRKAFERQVRTRFGETAAPPASASDGKATRELAYARLRLGEVLRALYATQRSVVKYIDLCEKTDLSANDCEAIVAMLQSRGKLDDALAWVERGLELEKSRLGAGSGYKLAEMKRRLLDRMGRGSEALDSAWAEFRAHPGTFTFEELMRYAPKAKRGEWRRKAMAASAGGDLHSVMELWLEIGEIARLAERVGGAADAEIENVSHYATEPAAKRLAGNHPDVAAKVYRALGMRILKAKKSKSRAGTRTVVPRTSPPPLVAGI